MDPQYARAYAGLASAYGPLGVHGYMSPEEGRERMREAARRAVELDNESAEAHAALGAYLHVYEWDWAGGEREYRRAIELDPNYPTAHLFYGFFLEGMGRFDESLAARRRAKELDPLAPEFGIGSAWAKLGRVDLARAAYQEVIELHPTYWLARVAMGELFEATGEPEEAVRVFETAVALAGRTPRPKAGLARLSGREREARELIQELRAEADASAIFYPTVAAALVAVRDTNGALDWLEASYRQRHPFLVTVDVDPAFAALRPDPRFQDLLRRIGFRR